MGHIEATRELPAPPDAIWETVADLSTWGSWFTIHDRWLEEPPATLTAGTKLTAKIVMLGMANKIEWTVEDVDPPGRVQLTGTGMAGVKCSFTFTLEPSGNNASTFTVTGDFDGALIKGALGKAVEKDGAKQLDQSLDQLGQLAAAKA